jgi:hypothetical protein
VKSILIVGNDLGFVFWLGQTLVSEGHQAWPAMGVPDAIALVRELDVPIDLLVMDPSLPEAPALIDCLRSTGKVRRVV